MLKVAQAAFAMDCFWGLLDVHECSSRLQMAPYREHISLAWPDPIIAQGRYPCAVIGSGHARLGNIYK